MKTPGNAKTIKSVSVIFRETTRGYDRILMGKCVNPNNPCFGMLIFPGGKVTGRELKFETALREGSEETGLIADKDSMIDMGEFHVRFTTSKIAHVGLVEAVRWTGELQQFPTRDFAFMKFFRPQDIPWDIVPLGEASMVMDIFQRLRVRTKIWCGENRSQFLRSKSSSHMQS